MPFVTVNVGAIVIALVAVGGLLTRPETSNPSNPSLEQVPCCDGIQEAIDLLPDGGVVALEAGNYLLDDPVRFSKGVTLRGQGRGTTYLVGDFKGPVLTRRGNEVTNVVLEGFTVDNTCRCNAGGIGVDFTNVSHSRMDIAIRNVETGVFATSLGVAEGEIYSNFNSIIKPDILEVSTGIKLLGKETNGWTISSGHIDSDANNPGDAGLYIFHPHALTVSSVSIGAFHKGVVHTDGESITLNSLFFRNDIPGAIGISYEGEALDMLVLNPYFQLTGEGSRDIVNTSFQKEKLYVIGAARVEGNAGIHLGRIGAVRETLRYEVEWEPGPVPPMGATSTVVEAPGVWPNSIVLATMNRDTGGAAGLLSPVVVAPDKVRLVLVNYTENEINLGAVDVTLLAFK
jgi:hypothetical protein